MAKASKPKTSTNDVAVTEKEADILNETMDMNLAQIQELIKFVAKSGVSEVSLEQKDFRITIKAQDTKGRVQEVIQVAVPQVAAPAPAATTVPAPAANANKFAPPTPPATAPIPTAPCSP